MIRKRLRQALFVAALPGFPLLAISATGWGFVAVALGLGPLDWEWKAAACASMLCALAHICLAVSE